MRLIAGSGKNIIIIDATLARSDTLKAVANLEVIKLSHQKSEGKDNDMSGDQNMLRAIVSRWSGGLQAQLLELDFAVQGTDEAQLLAEFAHAITVSYEIAVAHGEAPFSSVGEPPKAIREKWGSSSTVMKAGRIELRTEIAMALATALRWRKPAGCVVLEDAAAA